MSTFWIFWNLWTNFFQFIILSFRNTFFWNAFSAMMNSFQTMVLLLLITRTGTDTDSSIFVMAYAIGNLVLNVGKYGVRQYQVTDVQEQCKFRDYLRARYASMVFMFVSIFLYVGYNVMNHSYSATKAIVVVGICMVKAVESFEDVFHGRIQQKGRLDVAGRVLGVRLFIFVLGYGITYIVTKNLIFTTILNLGITVLVAIFLNTIAFQSFRDDGKSAGKGSVKRVLIECLPLCICMCLNMYIANAPKYIIDTIVSDEVQTRFNIVFMPVFVIALLATFIFQPYLKRLGEMWITRDVKKFVKTIINFSLVVLIIDLVITLVGSFIGGPILGMIYGVSLKSYNHYLIVFMLAGGIIALQNLFIMVVTTVRYQKFMIYGYSITALILFLFGKKILTGNGLFALCIFFLAMLTFLTLYCIALIVVAIKRESENR